jgi:hypothetical protein
MYEPPKLWLENEHSRCFFSVLFIAKKKLKPCVTYS